MEPISFSDAAVRGGPNAKHLKQHALVGRAKGLRVAQTTPKPSRRKEPCAVRGVDPFVQAENLAARARERETAGRRAQNSACSFAAIRPALPQCSTTRPRDQCPLTGGSVTPERCRRPRRARDADTDFVIALGGPAQGGYPTLPIHNMHYARCRTTSRQCCDRGTRDP